MVVMHDLVSALHATDTGRRQMNDIGEVDSTRDPDQPDLVDAITTNLLPPCAAIILEKITSTLTESTKFSRNSLEAHHQEYYFIFSQIQVNFFIRYVRDRCFAVALGADGMLDIARKSYLMTVEHVT